MAPPRTDSAAAARAAEARRRAEEARRRAEAEARARAEAARAAAERAKAQQAQQQQQAKKLFKADEVSTGRGTALRTKALGLTNAPPGQVAQAGLPIAAKDLIRTGGRLPPPASSLATENANDGQVNCLDRAVDHVNQLTPEQRKNAELVVLNDTRPGTEGRTGHVVVREGEQVVDPSTGRRFSNTQDYLRENPQYQEAGTVKAEDAKRIFDAPPGSPQRERALNAANVPPSLRTMMVADPPALRGSDPVLDSDHIANEPDPKKAASDLEIALKNNPDPAYRQQLLERLGPALPELARRIDGLGDDDARTALGSLSRAAEHAGPEGQRILDGVKDGEKVKAGLTALGLDGNALTGAKGAALLGAAGAAGTGKHIEALGYLGRAFNASPPGDRDAIRGAVSNLAQRLPDAGVGAIIKGLASNPESMNALLAQGGALDKFAAGDVAGATTQLLNDPGTQQATAQALLANPTTAGLLSKMGVTTPEQLLAVKDSVAGMVDAGQKFADGDLAGGFRALGSALVTMPHEVRAATLNAVLDSIPGLPQKAKDLVLGAEDILLNPDVAGKLGEAFDAMKAGDGAGFVKHIGEAVVAAGTTDTGKELQFKLLERLGRMDGPVGRFFSDSTLNRALVDSGAVNKGVEALTALANGDVGGAVDALGQVLPTLAGHGEHLNAAGVELPFSQEGLANLGRFFERVVDVLPDGVKRRIAEKGAELTARAGVKAIPILGNVVSAWDALSQIPDVVGAIQSGDGLRIALEAGQFVVDAAGVVPGLGSAVTPIRAAVGTVNALHDVLGSVETANEIKAGFDAYTA